MDSATLATIGTVVATASPLVFATVGETITERAGVVNLSLDGSILLSALTGFVVASTTGSVTLGFVGAAAVGAVIAGIVAFSSIRLRLDQVAVGFILTLLAAELSSFLGQDYVRQPGESVPAWPIPGLSDVPVVGPVFFDHDVVVYGSILLAVAAHWFLSHSPAGIDLAAVGERPEAAWARGIKVARTRYLATIVGGGLVGMAGAAYSLNVKLGWSEGHTTNLGWIALAIVIFGGWNPLRAMVGCWLFGGLQVVALELQGVDALSSLSQVLSILPFPLMILTLVVIQRPKLRELARRRPGLRRVIASDPPAALGTNFDVA